jgi:PD-(D/E)XK endonuclease
VTKFHPRQQGDLGEAAAIHWLTSIGAVVSVPLFHSPDYDLIAELGGRLARIQVKTSRRLYRTGNFAVQLATSGGNQSWTGVVKRFDRTRADFLFVLVGDGRRWFIPAHDLEGRRGISVGGSKYSEFQIGQTDPFDHEYSPASKLDRTGGRRSRRAGPDCKSGALVAEWVRFPPPPLPPPSGGELRSDDGDCRATGRTRMSSNNQVTVPLAVVAAASISPGDRFRVESNGPGRFVMTRIEEYMERHAAQLTLPDQARGPAGPERRAPD